MCANCLSIKRLCPPFASGGLWRRWCLLPSAGVRRYPPEAFGGANFRYAKRLSNIRHPSTKRIDIVFIYDGLNREDADKQALSEIIVRIERLK